MGGGLLWPTLGRTAGERTSAIGSPIRFATVDGVIMSPAANGQIRVSDPVIVTARGDSFVRDVQLYARDAAHATYSAAQAAGACTAISATMTVRFGGPNPDGGDLIQPQSLADVGFQSFSLVSHAACPEPGTCVLAGLGIGGIFLNCKRGRSGA